MTFIRIILLTLCLTLPFTARAANPQVEFHTSHGSFVVELYPDKAPRTVANFLEYVQNGFYEGTVFHRVIDKFMIQGGGFTADLQPKPTLPPIPNEANNGLKNEFGTLAMARRLDPDSATSQFFINLSDNKLLNYYRPQPDLMGYCVFGRVVRGMATAEKIGASPTRAIGGMQDAPQEAIVIERVALLDTPVVAEPTPPRPGAPAPSNSVKKGKQRG